MSDWLTKERLERMQSYYEDGCDTWIAFGMALAALDARYPRMQMMPDGTLQVLGADYAALQAKADRLAEALERSRDKISDGPFKTHIINQALADYRGK